jgi:DNA-binding Lrp family transcriptional regulator
MTADEIRSLAGLVPVAIAGPTASTSIKGLPTVEAPAQMNDSIKNLSGRQYQNVMRIVRQFGNGKLSKEQAGLMLKNGFGFNDNDVNTFLGIDDSPLTDDEVQKFSVNQDDKLIEAFAINGQRSENFNVIESKSFKDHEYFAESSALNQLEANILDLISKDKRITSEVIASTLNISNKVVDEAMKGLVDNEYLKVKETKIGTDIIIERELTAPISELQGKKSKVTEIMILYSYEWRDIVPANERNTAEHPSRAFCKRLMGLNKFYSRSGIEQISMIMGYSVWDRVGGWWTDPINPTPYQCRHEWKANVVTKK